MERDLLLQVFFRFMEVVILNISEIPCIDFYARRQAPLAMEPQFWTHCISACRQAGYTLDEIRCKVEDISFIYSVQLSILEEKGSFNQALAEYPKLEGKLPCCREYAKKIGINMDDPYANLCRVCPFSEQTGSANQEYSILTKIFILPDEDGIKYLDGRLEFNSYIDMDSGDIFSGTIVAPFVLPVASIIYKCICDDPPKFYYGIKAALHMGTAHALMQSAEIKNVVEEVYKTVVTVVDKMTNDPFGGCIDKDQIKETLLEYICNHVLLSTPASDMAFSLYVSSMDSEEDEEREDTELPPFGEAIEPAPALVYEEINSPVGKDDKDAGQQMDGDCSATETGYIEENADDINLETRKIGGEDTVPAGELKEYPLFEKVVAKTTGTWFNGQDVLMAIPYQSRRYKIPFAKNESASLYASKNVIIHHEIRGSALEKMMDISVQSAVSEEKRLQEINYLTDKVRKDFAVAVEIAYVTDREMYVMLIWNAGSRRIDYIPLIDKAIGQLKEIPYPVVQFLKSEKRRIICYQPYLLCGICSLYDRVIEIKTVYSIYSQFQVLARSMDQENGQSSCMMENIFESYFYAFNEKEQYKRDIFFEKYGEDAFFLAMMPLYQCISEKQISQALSLGITGLCISQAHKDLMYGYSYLGCSIYPSRQQAAFSVYPNGHIEFLYPMAPAISYVPGYVMEYTFLNIDNIVDGEIRQEVYENRRARKLLLKGLAGLQAAFYHNDLKILYMDDFHLIFFVTHKYRAVHATDIGQILMHETYRHKISSNKMKAVFWATSLTEIRYIDKH